MSTKKVIKTLESKGINEALINWVERKKFKSLSDVQKKVLNNFDISGDTNKPFLNQDMVVQGATGSGKTEAIFLPLLSKIGTFTKKRNFDVLYICPLKTLINQQFVRLTDLTNGLDLCVSPWHGEVRTRLKTIARKNNRGGIFITTPESIEGMFGRLGNQYRTELGALDKSYKDIYMLQHVKYIVIDEVHVYLGTDRGIHLQSLLNRLEDRFGQHCRIGMSATLMGIEEPVKKFIKPKDSNSVIVLSPDKRQKELDIKIKVFKEQKSNLIDEKKKTRKAPDKIAHSILSDFETCERWIVFADSRGLVEKYYDNIEKLENKSIKTSEKLKADEMTFSEKLLYQIKRNPSLVHLGRHHSSVLQKERELIEILMRLSPSIRNRNKIIDSITRDELLFIKNEEAQSDEHKIDANRKLIPMKMGVISTNTLELGIDIGKLEMVGQIGPGFSVTALKQRLGRSSHNLDRKERQKLLLYLTEREIDKENHILDKLRLSTFQALATVSLLQERIYEKPNEDNLHLSTLVHQFLSLIKEKGEVKLEEAYRLLVAEGPWNHNKIDYGFFQNLVTHLTWKRKEDNKYEIIKLNNDFWQLNRMTEIPKDDNEKKKNKRLADKIVLSGHFVTAFKNIDDYLIYHSGKLIGKFPSSVNYKPGETFIFAGQHWEIISLSDKPKRLNVIQCRKANVPRIAGEAMFISDMIIERMHSLYQYKSYDNIRNKLNINFNKTVQDCIIDGLKSYQEINNQFIFKDSSGGSVILPWKSHRILNTLMLALKKKGVWVVSAGIALIAPDSDPDDLKKVFKELSKEEVNFIELARNQINLNFEKYDWMFTPYFKRVNYRNAFLCREKELAELIKEFIST